MPSASQADDNGSFLVFEMARLCTSCSICFRHAAASLTTGHTARSRPCGSSSVSAQPQFSQRVGKVRRPCQLSALLRLANLLKWSEADLHHQVGIENLGSITLRQCYSTLHGWAAGCYRRSQSSCCCSMPTHRSFCSSVTVSG